jgi:hypothetical protein
LLQEIGQVRSGPHASGSFLRILIIIQSTANIAMDVQASSSWRSLKEVGAPTGPFVCWLLVFQRDEQVKLEELKHTTLAIALCEQPV